MSYVPVYMDLDFDILLHSGEQQLYRRYLYRDWFLNIFYIIEQKRKFLLFLVTTFKQVGVNGSLLLEFPLMPNWLKKPAPCDKILSATHSCAWNVLSDKSAQWRLETDSHVKHFKAKPLNWNYMKFLIFF